MKKCNVPLNVVNEVLKYLGNRPYIEVSELISMLHRNVTVVDTEPVVVQECDDCKCDGDCKCEEEVETKSE